MFVYVNENYPLLGLRKRCARLCQVNGALPRMQAKSRETSE
jgi:hypothetical protein